MFSLGCAAGLRYRTVMYVCRKLCSTCFQRLRLIPGTETGVDSYGPRSNVHVVGQDLLV